MIRFKHIAILFWLLFAVPVWATDYWVGKLCSGGAASPNCSDANTGTSSATAELTLRAGIEHLAAGDRLIVKAGTFSEDVDFYAYQMSGFTIPSGTAANPITMIPDTGAVVVIDGNHSNAMSNRATNMRFYTVKHWRIGPGFIFEGRYDGVTQSTMATGQYTGISVDADKIIDCAVGEVDGVDCGLSVGDYDFIITGNTFQNFAINSIFIGADGTKVLNNEIKDGGKYGLETPAFGYCIYNTGAYGVTDGNDCHGMGRYGFQFYSQIVPVGHSHDNIIRNNKVHGNGVSSGAAGMVVGGGRQTVYNNIVYSNIGHGIEYSFGNGTFTGTKFLNNTTFANTGYGLAISTSSDTAQTTVQNNIFWSNTLGSIYLGSGVGEGLAQSVTLDHNLCKTGSSGVQRNANGTFANCSGTGSLTGSDPLFVDESLFDLRITSLSPGKDAGTTKTEFNFDYFNNVRPEVGGTLWDIGAHESGAAPPSTTRVTTITEPFTGTATNPLTTPNWQQLCTAQATLVYASSNRVTSAATANPIEYGCARWIGSGVTGNNQWIQLELASTLASTATYRDQQMVVCGRMSADADTLRDGYCSDIVNYTGYGEHITELYKVLNGTQFYLSSTISVHWSSGDGLAMELNGTTISTLKGLTGILSVSDSDLTTGRIGIGGAGTSNIYDNMTGGYLGSLPTEPETTLHLSGGDLGLEEYLFVNGTISAATSGCRTGSGCIRNNPTTTAVGYFLAAQYDSGGLPNYGTQTTQTFSFYFKPVTVPGSNYECFAMETVDSGGFGLAPCIDSSRHLRVYKVDAFAPTATQCGSTGATTVSNAWWRIELTATKGTSGAFDLKIAPDDNTPSVSEVSGTCNSGTGAWQEAWIGKVANVNGQTVDWYFDDIVEATQEPGPHKVRTLVPDAAGNYAVCNNGTSSLFSAVDDFITGVANDGDTTYIGETGSGACNSSFNLNSSATNGISGVILGIEAWAFQRRVAGDTAAVGLRTGSTDFLSSQATLTAAYLPYGKTFTLNPNTLNAWTTAELDAVEALVNSATGVDFRATAMGIHVLFDDTGIPTSSSHPYYYSLLGNAQ